MVINPVEESPEVTTEVCPSPSYIPPLSLIPLSSILPDPAPPPRYSRSKSRGTTPGSKTGRQSWVEDDKISSQYHDLEQEKATQLVKQNNGAYPAIKVFSNYGDR